MKNLLVKGGVISGDDGFISSTRKPFCSPLAQFHTWRECKSRNRRCKRARNGPIGDSVGRNVSLAMLAHLLPHHLRSLSMVFRLRLLKSFGLMW